MPRTISLAIDTLYDGRPTWSENQILLYDQIMKHTSAISLCIQMFLTSWTVTLLSLDTPRLGSYNSCFWAALILRTVQCLI